MEKRQNDEIDLLELFFALLHRIWVIIVAAIVGAVIAFLYTALAVTPMYSSTSMVYILGDSMDVSSIINMQIGASLTTDYEIVVTSRPVVEKVINDLELDMTYEELKKSITVTNTDNSHILQLKVMNPDPDMAKTIVDDLTQVVIQQTASIMESAEPNIIQQGERAEVPDTPNMKKNIVMGGAVGFVLAVIVLSILYLLNDTVKTPEDIEKYLEMNILGTIPLEEGAVKNKSRGFHIRERLKSRKKAKKH